MFLGIFGELLGSGGIQRVNKHACATLSSIANAKNKPYKFLSLNDPKGTHEINAENQTFKIQGFGKNKTIFVSNCLKNISKTNFAYIAHANMSPIGIILKFLNPKLKYFVAIYGIDVWEKLSILKRIGMKNANGITSVCDYTAKKAAMIQKIPNANFFIIPSSLPDEVVNTIQGIDSSVHVNSSKKILLTVGRMSSLEQYKGMDLVIQSLPIILKAIPNTYYYIIGEGDDMPRLKKLAAEMGVEENVVFTGKVGDELNTFYNLGDIFVMPSRDEGLSLVYVEAMSWGKPIVACNSGGTPEIVSEGKTGFLIQYGDIKMLSSRLKTLLKDEDLCKKMGNAGRKKIHENYTFKHFKEKLTKAINSI